jgi:hypothetical protein
MSGRRGVLEDGVPRVGLLPATEAVSGSGLGVVQVEQVLCGFR